MNGERQASLWREAGAPGAEKNVRWVDVLKFVLGGARFSRAGEDSVRLRSVAKHFVACLPHLKTFRGWLVGPGNIALKEALSIRPSMVRSVARPYVNARWRATRKLQVIREHYHLVRGRLDFLRFPPWHSIPLGTVDGCVQIRLEKLGWFEHEGELALSLFSDNTRLYSLAFTLGETDFGAVAYVGALQGLGRDDALAVYRALTRRMHGLRPRDLLVASFRYVCVSIEVKQILAISDDACVGRSKYFGDRRRLFSSYDRAWTENGGVEAADGFFELSPRVCRRVMDKIPSRKRAQHRRRYEMLDELAVEISKAVERASHDRAVGCR